MASYRALLLLALSLLVALAWTAPPPAGAQVEVRTQLGWLRNGEFAPVMVAEAKGFFTSEDTRKNGLLWMNPMVWDEMMAFYEEYDQIPRVVPAEEMMTNWFNPGITR